MKRVILILIFISLGTSRVLSAPVKPVPSPEPTASEESSSGISEFFKKYLPKSLSENKDAQKVGSEIETKVGENFTDELLNGDFFRRSSFGKWILGVKESLSKSYSFGPQSQKPTDQKDPEGLFKFDVQAYKEEAGLHYDGYLSPVLKYKARDRQFEFSLSQDLSPHTQLLFTEAAPLNSSLSEQIKLQYSF